MAKCLHFVMSYMKQNKKHKLSRVCSRDGKSSLRWLTTVLMEYKSTIFNSFEKGSKLFFPSLFNACLSLLPFYVKFEQLNVNKWPK